MDKTSVAYCSLIRILTTLYTTAESFNRFHVNMHGEYTLMHAYMCICLSICVCVCEMSITLRSVWHIHISIQILVDFVEDTHKKSQ